MVCSFHRNELYEVVFSKIPAVREGNHLIRRTVKDQYRFRIIQEIALANIVCLQIIKQRARYDNLSVEPDQRILSLHDTFILVGLYYGSGKDIIHIYRRASQNDLLKQVVMFGDIL